jgi:hypothetical protein
LAFLDEEELAPQGADPGPSRYGGDRQRQILVRRGIAAGALILFLILVVLGVRGCLDARKQRSFENYVSDLKAITAQSQQLSTDFFNRLSNTKSGGQVTEFRAEIASDRGTAEGLVTRVRDLSVPDELTSAQSELLQAFELRSDGLTGVSDQINNLSPQNQNEAADAVAGYMKYFIASDVLYAKARAEIDQTLADQNVNEKAPESVFLTDPQRWIDPNQVSLALVSVAGTGKATSGVHGLGLSTVTIGGSALTEGTAATVSGTDIEVTVENQGDSDEHNIVVSYKLTGGTQTSEGDTTIPKIVAGGTGTAKLRIQPAPTTGQQLSLEISVSPVPGEQVATNNTATYDVTFS